ITANSAAIARNMPDQWLGRPGMLRAMAALFAVVAVITLWAPATPPTAPRKSDVRRDPVGFVAMPAAGAGTFWLLRQLPWQWLGGGRFASLGADTLMLLAACFAALQAARRAGFPSFLAPWDAFFSRERAAALLAMIVLYKLGDAFAGSLST